MLNPESRIEFSALYLERVLFQGLGLPKLELKKDTTNEHSKVYQGINPVGLNHREL